MLSFCRVDATNRIRVLIVDDQVAVRSALKFVLLAFDDLELVGESADGEQAVQLCIQAQPDVVLMDLLMPRMNGINATRAIREYCPRVQVVALTSLGEEELAQSALEAGASGYLLKNVSAEELAGAIRAAHAVH
jgi:NarL family two-component system response regulator LiaR